MDVWPACLHRLESELPPEEMQALLKPLQSDRRDRRLVLYAPNAYVLEEVRARFLPRIRELATHYDDAIEDVGLEIGARPRPAPAAAARPDPAATVEEPFQGNLDAHFTFENFVEGRSNQMGRAAAWRVALKPGDRTHNPLLLYGGTGLGKTHLMVAAGNEMRRINPDARVLYMTSSDFGRAFFTALKSHTTDQFKRQFERIDALLIDDVQFFAGKEYFQEEFFHTFNALFSGRQQIVMTCDRYPREVDKLEPRLKSRLGSGLAVAIDPPDYETRALIVLAKAHEQGFELSDEVAFFLAKKLRSNVRDLEGALHTLLMQASFSGRPVDVAFAQEALRDALRAQLKAVGIGNIQKVVADYYGLQMKELLGEKRNRSLARPRQMAMALCRELTEHSLPEIAAEFGGRDHTTVMHADRKIRALKETDGKLREDWEKLIRKLSE